MPRTGIDRFERRSRGDQHALAGERFGCERMRRSLRRSPRARACGPCRFRRTPGRRSPGPSMMTPSARKLRDVALGRRVLPTSDGSSPARPAAGSRARGTASRADRRQGRGRAWRENRPTRARRRSRRRRATDRCAPCCRRRGASHRSVNTGWPDSACIVAGVMKPHAASVITTCTSVPSLTSRRTSSAAL